MSQYFDGVLIKDERSPKGYKKVKGSKNLFVNRDLGKLVVIAEPNKAHNCDQRGCGSFEHKIAEFNISNNLFRGLLVKGENK